MPDTIFPLPALKDNYIWCIFDKTKNGVWVVDPGDALNVIHHFDQQKKRLLGILLTHHHWDHSGGVTALLKHFGKVPVVGSHLSKVNFVSEPVDENDEITCAGIRFKILEIPGHTIDHIAFYANHTLFCGDTLFSAGCGKIFEGTYNQMFDSLNKIFNLPEETKIYCGHEYTLANLVFAERVEPNNQQIKEKLKQAQEKMAARIPTLPSLLKDEKLVNPFLRCHETTVIEAVERHTKKKLSDPIEIFIQLREWKNHFAL